jgi:acyl-CoA synthetase (AMP-forming)/AMP-acid ligase II
VTVTTPTDTNVSDQVRSVMDSEGYLQLVDRAKDPVKSGGKWISSVDIEGVMGHPEVEAAVIGGARPTWQERPLARAAPRPGEELTKEEILEFLQDKVAKWWLPDDVVVVEEIPKKSVDKFSKKELRAQFEDYKLPTA